MWPNYGNQARRAKNTYLMAGPRITDIEERLPVLGVSNEVGYIPATGMSRMIVLSGYTQQT